mgnify:FL=1
MDDRTAAFLNRMNQVAQGTFWDFLGARLESFAPDHVVVALDVQPHHLNLIGILHGGVYATLLDSAMGLAAMAAKPDESLVTTNLNIHYLSPVRLGTIKVTGKILHSSRKMITTEGRVHNSDGELCAFGTGTFRVISRNTDG